MTALAACGGGGSPADPVGSDAGGSGSGGSDSGRSEPAGSANASTGATAPAGATGPAAASPAASPTPAAAELPRGGRSVFPEHTVIAYYGTTQGGGDLGVLGQGTPDEQAAELAETAASYAPLVPGTTVLPAFELITTTASAAKTAEGDYSHPLTDEQVQTYLDAARRAKALLILDLQPGTADLLDQAKMFERFLREPDVGIALDPEWKLKPGQRHLRQVGQLDAEEINRVSAYVAGLVAEDRLPEKIFMVHQFQSRMITNREQVVMRPGLETVIHMDGHGDQESKLDTYRVVSAKNGEFVNAFKLFYDEDIDLMTPAEAMALVPRPSLISYQ